MVVGKAEKEFIKKMFGLAFVVVKVNKLRVFGLAYQFFENVCVNFLLKAKSTSQKFTNCNFLDIPFAPMSESTFELPKQTF